MKRSSVGWPIDFTDNELKILWLLADDKGHSEKEIAERMVDKEQYQVVYSKSLSNVDNVSKELSKLCREDVVYYESRNISSEKANREYPVKYYHIDPMYYPIIRDITKRLKEEAHWRIFEAFEEGIWTKEDMRTEEDRYDEKEGLYHYVHIAFEYMVNHFNDEYEKSCEVFREGEYWDWSPALSVVKRLAARVRNYYKIPDPGTKIGIAISESVVCELRPDLLKEHRKWLEDNPLVSVTDSESDKGPVI